MSTIRLFCLASLLTVVSSVALGSDIVTTNGVVYSNIKRMGGDPWGVKILHKNGVDYMVDYIPFNMMNEADRKKYGDVVTQGYREAANRFRKAAEAGDRDAMFSLAVCYTNGEGVAKDDAEAFKWYLKASEKGNAAAMFVVGRCYSDGVGVSVDEEKMLEWYRKSALFGNTRGMLALALFYQVGLHVEQNYKEAFDWFRKAYEGGNLDSIVFLHRCYLRGEGTEKNQVEAEKCLMAGVAGEDAYSMYWYGLEKSDKGGEIIAPPKIQWLIKAANKGSVDAMFTLGIYYANGQGVEKNKVEAFNWYLKVAENVNVVAMEQNVVAMEQVSRRYSRGEGVGKNNEKAAQWCLMAAQNGSVRSMYLLGVRYANGDGVPKNEKEAFKWQLKAAENGDKMAMSALAYYYEQGVGVEINFEASCMWLRKAADNGIVPAIHAMGLAYAIGTGVPQNDFLAYTWLSLAAAKGESDGMELRDEVRMRLSPEMVTKAQLLAKNWFENGTAQTGVSTDWSQRLLGEMLGQEMSLPQQKTPSAGVGSFAHRSKGTQPAAIPAQTSQTTSKSFTPSVSTIPYSSAKSYAVRTGSIESDIVSDSRSSRSSVNIMQFWNGTTFGGRSFFGSTLNLGGIRFHDLSDSRGNSISGSSMEIGNIDFHDFTTSKGGNISGSTMHIGDFGFHNFTTPSGGSLNGTSMKIGNVLFHDLTDSQGHTKFGTTTTIGNQSFTDWNK